MAVASGSAASLTRARGLAGLVGHRRRAVAARRRFVRAAVRGRRVLLEMAALLQKSAHRAVIGPIAGGERPPAADAFAGRRSDFDEAVPGGQTPGQVVHADLFEAAKRQDRQRYRIGGGRELVKIGGQRAVGICRSAEQESGRVVSVRVQGLRVPLGTQRVEPTRDSRPQGLHGQWRCRTGSAIRSPIRAPGGSGSPIRAPGGSERRRT